LGADNVAASVVVEYRYDAFDNRMERLENNGTTTTERFAYEGWDTAHPGAIDSENFDAFFDLSEGSEVTTRRIYGAGFDDLVARYDDSATGWYLTDYLGSDRGVLDDGGNVSGAATYDGWGNVTSGTPVDRVQYTGRERDAATGLRHNGWRSRWPSTSC